MILGHLQSKSMDESLLHENLNNIKQYDRPSDNGNMEIVNIGTQKRWARNTFLEMRNNHLNQEVM
jgi:hypothetical protein